MTNPRSEEFTQDGELLATWWRMNSPGAAYWRCTVPARHLPGQVLYWNNRDLAEQEDRFVFPRQVGTAIWQFAGNASTGMILRGMQTEQGIRVLMEADDNYLVAPDSDRYARGDWQAELDTNGYTDRFSYPAHARIVEFVDGVIVSTDVLADEYHHLNPNIYVCPNSIDPADWPEPEKPNDGILRIGWAASHSHIVDVPLVRRALMWAADQPGVEVYVYGLADIVKFPGRVRRVPWTDNLADYRASLGRLDVQICPLIETRWSRSKSDLKALESAMAGSWPIVSTAAPYKPWQDRTITCTTAKDWERALRWAVVHRDEIPALAREARDYVMSHRTIEKTVRLWREAVAG